MTNGQTKLFHAIEAKQDTELMTLFIEMLEELAQAKLYPQPEYLITRSGKMYPNPNYLR